MKLRTLLIFIKLPFLYCAAGVVAIFFVVLSLPLALMPVSMRFDNRWFFWVSNVSSRMILWLAGFHCQIEGLENIPSYPDTPSIILANHTSAFDIPLVEMILNQYPHVWISKEGYGKVPFFGFILRRMALLLKRGDSENSTSILKQSYKLVHNKKRHIVIFPEGRRYDDGNIHEFYEGFVALASLLQRPVVPVVIWGLHKIYPKNSIVIDSSVCDVKISIGKPMYYGKEMSRKEFVALVHGWFTAEIAKLSKS